MAKTSLLPDAGPFTGEETVPFVQDGVLKKGPLSGIVDALTLQATTARNEAVEAAALFGVNTQNPGALGAIGGLDALNDFTRRAAGYYSVRDQAWVSNNNISALLSLHRFLTDFNGMSAVQGSGVVSAGASVKSTSGINGSLPRHLEAILQSYNPEHIVINRGVSAAKSPSIMARGGYIPMLITLAVGENLPAAGAVACTASPGLNGPSENRANSPDVYTGYIGTQQCRLIAVDNASNNPKQYTIEQVGGVGDITIKPATAFWISDRSMDRAIKAMWATQNDPDNQTSYNMIGAFVDALPQDERRFFIMGDWTFADGLHDIGSAAHTNMIAKNLWFQNRYGRNFIDVHALISGIAPYDGSIWPSLAQLAGEVPDASYNWGGTSWLTLGREPRRWMSIHKGGVDVNHFHEDTNYWLARFIVEFIYKPRGWLK